MERECYCDDLYTAYKGMRLTDLTLKCEPDADGTSLIEVHRLVMGCASQEILEKISASDSNSILHVPYTKSIMKIIVELAYGRQVTLPPDIIPRLREAMAVLKMNERICNYVEKFASTLANFPEQLEDNIDEDTPADLHASSITDGDLTPELFFTPEDGKSSPKNSVKMSSLIQKNGSSRGTGSQSQPSDTQASVQLIQERISVVVVTSSSDDELIISPPRNLSKSDAQRLHKKTVPIRESSSDLDDELMLSPSDLTNPDAQRPHKKILPIRRESNSSLDEELISPKNLSKSDAQRPNKKIVPIKRESNSNSDEELILSPRNLTKSNAQRPRKNIVPIRMESNSSSDEELMLSPRNLSKSDAQRVDKKIVPIRRYSSSSDEFIIPPRNSSKSNAQMLDKKILPIKRESSIEQNEGQTQTPPTKRSLQREKGTTTEYLRISISDSSDEESMYRPRKCLKKEVKSSSLTISQPQEEINTQQTNSNLIGLHRTSTQQERNNIAASTCYKEGSLQRDIGLSSTTTINQQNTVPSAALVSAQKAVRSRSNWCTRAISDIQHLRSDSALVKVEHKMLSSVLDDLGELPPRNRLKGMVQLLETVEFRRLENLCEGCLKFHADIKGHVKLCLSKFKESRKKYITCPECDTSFSHETVLRYHICKNKLPEKESSSARLDYDDKIYNLT